MKLDQRISKLEARSPFGRRQIVILVSEGETEEEALKRKGIDRVYPDDEVLLIELVGYTREELAA